MGSLFVQVLVIVCCIAGIESKYIGIILFLVYVGGLMILISYCVMLMPSNKFQDMTMTMFFFMTVMSLSFTMTVSASDFSYGLLYSASVVLLLGLLLFLVMIAVVGIIDYASGMMKS